jgi:cytochrome c-type biogenesis protein CcmH
MANSVQTRRAGSAAALVLAGALALGAVPALAVEPDEILKDPALEARARALSKDLRCMVCQNQSIDDSEAPLAKDLRVLVRERLVAGDSDSEVNAFLVARYGDFVLLKPPFDWRTALLWTSPFLLLLTGLAIALRSARRRVTTSPAPLSQDERRAVEEILKG